MIAWLLSFASNLFGLHYRPDDDEGVQFLRQKREESEESIRLACEKPTWESFTRWGDIQR